MYTREMIWERYIGRGSLAEVAGAVARQLDAEANAVLPAVPVQLVPTEENKATATLPLTFSERIATHEELRSLVRLRVGEMGGSLEEMKGRLEQLSPLFWWATGPLAWSVEQQSGLLEELIYAGPTPEEKKVLSGKRSEADRAFQEASASLQAGEIKDARGWFANAESRYLEVLGINDMDFAAHHALGLIYMYHPSPQVDWERAQKHFEAAARLTTLRVDPNASQLASYAAQAHVLAGFVCYQLRRDDEAISHTQRATAYNPENSRAFYTLAKFAAATGSEEVAIPALRAAIRANKEYAVAACYDRDFLPVRTAARELMDQLVLEVKSEVSASLARFRAEMTSYAFWDPAQEKLENDCNTVQQRLTGDLAYLRAKDVQHMLNEYWKALEVGSGEMGLLASAAGPITALAFSPDGSMVVFAARDSTVRLWDPVQKQELRALKGHTAPVRALVFSSDGQTLASGGDDATVRLWQVASGQEAAAPMRQSSPVIKLAMSPGGTGVASAGSDGRVVLWFLSHEHQWYHKTWTFQSSAVITFSVDGSRVATMNHERKRIGVWDAHRESPHSWIRDAQPAQLWNANTWKDRAWTSVSHDDTNLAAAFSSDPVTLAFSDGDRLCLWDVEKPAENREQGGLGSKGTDSAAAPVILAGHTGRIYSVSFGLDGAALASGSEDHTVRLWELQTRQERAVLKGHSSAVTVVALSPDGTVLASGSEDGTVRLWWVAVRPDDWNRVQSVRKEFEGWAEQEQEEFQRKRERIEREKADAEWEERERRREALEKKKAQEQKEREEQERLRKHLQQQEELRRKEQLKQERREAGLCEECGEKLGWLEKRLGYTLCAKCRISDIKV